MTGGGAGAGGGSGAGGGVYSRLSIDETNVAIVGGGRLILAILIYLILINL